ncbi:MAG: helix-turn-helix transcriptional regulator [Bacteroidia bacterium]|nr:helix-turn-helix transcriptional regulator [Bacteroidia bacterium]
MKKNPRFEERRRSIPKEIDVYVTRSFDIVDRIHEILKMKNLSQKDLAFLLDKKESEVSKWMSGTHNFTLKTLIRIEDILGFPIIKVISKEKYKEKQPILLVVEKKYSHIIQGQDILVGDIQDLEIKQKYQKPTPYLS